MSERKHLIRRGQTWFVRKRLPPEVHHALGTEMVRTTGTRSLEEARRRRWAILADIQRQVDAVRNSRDPGSPAWLVEKAKAMLREARNDEQKAAVVDDIGLELLIEQLTKLRGLKLDEDGHPIVPDDATDAAITTAAELLRAGPSAVLLSDVIDVYLSETEDRVTRQTYNAKARRLESFKTWVTDQPIERLTRRHAGHYVEILMTRRNAPKTVRDTISDLGAFFKWAMARGYIELNPFDGMSATVRESTRGGSRFARRAWTPDELHSLLTKLDRSNAIHDRLFAIVSIGAFSGMRLNEICDTELKDVHEDAGYIHIPEGKTESSVRDVPIHPKLRKLIRKLRETSTDGYLISGLRPGGEDRKRSHYVSKDFGRIKRRLKVCDVSKVNGRDRDRIDFHALRMTFNTALANAGVPTPVREAIVGHSSSGGVNESIDLDRAKLPELDRAVRKVSYGDAVDAFVSKA